MGPRFSEQPNPRFYTDTVFTMPGALMSNCPISTTAMSEPTAMPKLKLPNLTQRLGAQELLLSIQQP
jgi:hypothetical protein